MAEKRMFTKKIIDSDAFLDMPLSAQALYFHLNMRADDDGFINNPKKIQRMIGASEDDLKLLIAKRFVLAFENGIIVIKHWRMHNLIRKDRYNPTQYQEQMKLLNLKDNGSYTEKLLGNQMATKWQPNDNQMAPQVSIGKDSIDKDIDSEEPEKCIKKKIIKNTYGEYNNVFLTDEEFQKLQNEYPDYLDKIESLSSYIASSGKEYKSHYATIKNWARKVKEQKQQIKKNSFNNFKQRDYDMEELEKRLLKNNMNKDNY